jgi:hypothetical protein
VSASRSPTDLPPAGLTWAEYVERWVADCGGWLPLADRLIHRAGASVDIAQDPQTVERGLRRLARRAHKPGGQYGRWLLRFFGVTSPVEHWVRWLGSSHTRFADLPSGLRLEQLALWNRPPIAESPLAAWIHVGIASAHHSRLDLDAFGHWLARAESHAAAAGVAAVIETGLLRAELATSADDHASAERVLDVIGRRLLAAELPASDALPYRARLETLRATRFTRPPLGAAPDLQRAREHYAAIPDAAIPFVMARKCVGLGYCAWKLGERDEALGLAVRAVEEAGDGGLVRMRVTALNLLSRILAGDSAAAVNARARRMAAALDDEELLRRVSSCAPGARPPAA